MNNQFIQGVTFDWDRIDNDSYLKRIEAFGGVKKLDFNKPVTFFVGENGSGKSTLLEALAVAHGFNPEGGTKNYVFSTHDTHSELCDAIRISKGYRKEKWGYFLRAESFYNVATQEEEYADFKHPSAKYHEKSHGESFLALAQNNLRPNGLYLFDEPEAALSPQRQLTLLMQIYRCAKEGAQFFIVTHSPILLGIPDADIYCSGYIFLKGFNDLQTTHPEIASEWSEKNLSLKPDEVNAKSRKNVWWKCRKCGNEWKSVINARVKGTVCPVCAEREVLAGYNDLATTDSQLLSEWDYEQNKLKPTQVSRTSAKRAWWKCRHGHSWSMKINERTILNKGCRICEQEYLSLFPALAVSYYSNRKGLKAELGSDRLLGVPLETYIPSEKLAIESGSADENIEIMKAYMCKQRGIRLIKLPMKGTELDYADSLKRAFQSVHIFISSDTEEDVEIIKNTFERWRDSQ